MANARYDRMISIGGRLGSSNSVWGLTGWQGDRVTAILENASARPNPSRHENFVQGRQGGRVRVEVW